MMGHIYGWDSDKQRSALGNVDQHIGDIIGALEKKHLLSDTIIIATADHGGCKNNHDGIGSAYFTVPWLIRGPNIEIEMKLNGRNIRNLDSAPTLLYATGYDIPIELRGRPVYEAFSSAGAKEIQRLFTRLNESTGVSHQPSAQCWKLNPAVTSRCSLAHHNVHDFNPSAVVAKSGRAEFLIGLIVGAFCAVQFMLGVIACIKFSNIRDGTADNRVRDYEETPMLADDDDEKVS